MLDLWGMCDKNCACFHICVLKQRLYSSTQFNNEILAMHFWMGVSDEVLFHHVWEEQHKAKAQEWFLLTKKFPKASPQVHFPVIRETQALPKGCPGHGLNQSLPGMGEYGTLKTFSKYTKVKPKPKLEVSTFWANADSSCSCRTNSAAWFVKSWGVWKITGKKRSILVPKAGLEGWNKLELGMLCRQLWGSLCFPKEWSF